MSNSANQDPQATNHQRQRLWLTILKGGGVTFSLLLLLGTIGVAWRLWNFAQKELAPLASQTLTTSLKRPVNLGRITEISLTGVKFAASSIPPTPTDREQVTIESVEAGFDIWQLIVSRRLLLDVTLVNPHAYLEQGSQGSWLKTKINPPQPTGPIKTVLDKIRFRNAKVVLVSQNRGEVGKVTGFGFPIPEGAVPVEFADLSGTAQILENNHLIKVELAGTARNGGNVFIQGDIRPGRVLVADLQVKAQDLLGADVTNLVKLPLRLTKGRVNGDVGVKLTPNQQTLLYGSAGLMEATLKINKVPQLLQNTQGDIAFQGLAIKLDNLVTSYGKIPLIASGIIDRKSGFKLTARINAVSLARATETLKIKSPVPVSGTIKADLQIVGGISSPILSGHVSSLKTAYVDKIAVKRLYGDFNLSSITSVVTVSNFKSQLALGGEVVGGGKIKLGKVDELNLGFTANKVPGAAIAQLYKLNIPSQTPIGEILATAQVTGAANQVETAVKWKTSISQYLASGETKIHPDKSLSFQNVVVNIGQGIIRAEGNYVDQHWQVLASLAHVQVNPFIKEEKLQNISLDKARLNGRLRLSGISSPFQVNSIHPEGFGLEVAGGRVGVSQIQLQDKNLIVGLVAENVHLGQILAKAPPVLQNPLTGNFIVAGNLDNFTSKTIRALGKASLFIGNGALTATNIQLVNGHYIANVAANNVLLQRLSTVSVPPELRASAVTGQFHVAGMVDALRPDAIAAVGEARVNIPGGIVTASHILLADGRYQAKVVSSHLQLSKLNSQLPGNLSANLQVTGTVASTKLADLRADGTVQFSRGIGGVSPLDAAIAWNGQQLTINHADSRNLHAHGYILTNATNPGIPQITQVNLHVQAQDYNLQQLPVKLPAYVEGLSGKMDFLGEVTGSLTAPNVVGILGFHNLKLRDLAFDPLLTGNINLSSSINSGKSLSADLAGKPNGDRLALNFNLGNRPNSFLVKWQQALATGVASGDNWRLQIANFPIQALNLKLPRTIPLGNQAIAGLLTGNLQVNQKTLATTGDIAIAHPEFGRLKGDSFSTQLSYRNGLTSIIKGDFIKGASSYNFDGSFLPTSSGPKIQANVNITKGNIQDILTTAQIFEIQDLQRGLTPATYGTAADLTTVPQGLPNQPLLSQIQRLYEIDTLVQKRKDERQAANPIPELRDLKGTFNGSINVNNITANGLTAKFRLIGENFDFGRKEEINRFYHADRVVVDGGFEKGVLRLQPLLFRSQKRLIVFKGYIGGKEQSGQLRVTNFPIQVLENFIKLPFQITGNLNGTAALAGSISNPQARGELEVTDGTLNEKKLAAANASFSYDAGRLYFGSKVSTDATEPVNVIGKIPYKLPFASVEPDSNQISLSIKVKNEGLTLLNLLTDQIAFENGEGDVNLQVAGTIQHPLVKGIASLNNAVFSAQALPGKLTNVSGSAKFNLDQVSVEQLQGKYSQGKVEAKGEIPIVNSEDGAVKVDNSLRINLDKLTLNLKGLYQGGVSGDLEITGSVFNPVIGGQIDLSNGQVLLADSTDSNTSSGNANLPALRINKQGLDNTNRVTRLNNLALNLGKNIQIARQPILLFQATGGLIVNGFLSNPIPEGTIKLTGGEVNLFTTRFKLARGYNQTATFNSFQPRDPDLDIRLFAKVLDVIQQSDIVKANSNGLGSLETVQVEANVVGPASKLNDNLELTSSPTRSQTEIVTLLGGGFVDTEGRTDSNLGLINIAGSAVFNNFQGAFNEIANVFGLSEFRIFPTIVSNSPKDIRSYSTIELAVEAGVDISRKFSVSGIKLLTDSDPTQFGLNYRINDQLRIRASTNLTDDNRAVIEFQKRF